MINEQATEACDKLATVLHAAQDGVGSRRDRIDNAWATVRPVVSGDEEADRQLVALGRQLSSVRTMSDVDLDSTITHLMAVHWRLAELRYG